MPAPPLVSRLPVVELRAATTADRAWLRSRIERAWGLPVVSVDAVYDAPETLDALVAAQGGARLGAVTWSVSEGAVEVVTLEAVHPRLGIGRALMHAVLERAVDAGGTRLWLITTDDNPTASAFYAAIGMDAVRRHPQFSDRVRVHKPDLDGDFDAVEYEWDVARHGPPREEAR